MNINNFSSAFFVENLSNNTIALNKIVYRTTIVGFSRFALKVFCSVFSEPYLVFLHIHKNGKKF